MGMSQSEEWIFPKEFVEDITSARFAKCSLQKEKEYRFKTIWFMHDLSNALRKNPRVRRDDDPDYEVRIMKVFWTACTFFHRFYLFHSFDQLDRFDVAIACLFLAGKVEEKPLNLKDHVGMYFRVRRNMVPDENVRLERAKEVLKVERILLHTLNFDLNVTHPFSFFKAILGKELKPWFSDSEESKRVLKLATTLASDSMRSTVCLEFTPKQTAYALVFLALTIMALEPSSSSYRGNTEQSWLEIFEREIDENILKSICFRLIDLYADHKFSPAECSYSLHEASHSTAAKARLAENLEAARQSRLDRATSATGDTGTTDSPVWSSQSQSPSYYPHTFAPTTSTATTAAFVDSPAKVAIGVGKLKSGDAGCDDGVDEHKSAHALDSTSDLHGSYSYHNGSALSGQKRKVPDGQSAPSSSSTSSSAAVAGDVPEPKHFKHTSSAVGIALPPPPPVATAGSLHRTISLPTPPAPPPPPPSASLPTPPPPPPPPKDADSQLAPPPPPPPPPPPSPPAAVYESHAHMPPPAVSDTPFSVANTPSFESLPRPSMIAP